MEFLKQWTMCVCSTLVISAIMLIFSPKGSLKRLYKIVISMFIVISFVYPLKNLSAFENFNISIKGVEETISTDTVYENLINSKVKEMLNENGYFGCNVTSSATQNYEDVVIEKVTVYIPDEYEINEIKKCVLDNLGINAEVIHIGD